MTGIHPSYVKSAGRANMGKVKQSSTVAGVSNHYRKQIVQDSWEPAPYLDHHHPRPQLSTFHFLASGIGTVYSMGGGQFWKTIIGPCTLGRFNASIPLLGSFIFFVYAKDSWRFLDLDCMKEPDSANMGVFRVDLCVSGSVVMAGSIHFIGQTPLYLWILA